MKTLIETWNCQCDKCQHTWQSRAGLPLQCPRCKSARWDKGERSEPLKESQPKPIIDPQIAIPEASADQWLGWSDERTTYDAEKGENVTYRQHIKSGRREIIQSETAY